MFNICRRIGRRGRQPGELGRQRPQGLVQGDQAREARALLQGGLPGEAGCDAQPGGRGQVPEPRPQAAAGHASDTPRPPHQHHAHARPPPATG